MSDPDERFWCTQCNKTVLEEHFPCDHDERIAREEDAREDEYRPRHSH